MSVDLAWLPRGRGLAEPDFEARHRLVTIVLGLHLPVIVVYAMASHHTFDVGLLAASPVAGLLALAIVPGARLRRSLAASLGLLVSSAVLVHLASGLIEMHFHYFVAVAIIGLYQEWLVYAVAIGFVLLEHGLLGQMSESTVFVHPGNTWASAAVHAGFVCAMASAQLAFWHYQERSRANEEHYRSELYDGQQSIVARLADAAQLRSDLVGTVTHEFRTPLTGISAALLTLRRRRHRLDDPKIDELLDAALLHSERLRRLLENMLTAAEATAVDPGVVTDVTAVAHEVVAGLSSRQRERLTCDLPDGLDAHVGQVALHQVLGNLLDNAFTHAYPLTPVRLSGGRVGSDVVVRVRNRGPEISPELSEVLLQPFTQADPSATRTREGAGLGLYVVRRLVEVHGGKLALHTSDGEIVAEINLPAQLVPDTPAALTSPAGSSVLG
jgi:signal transduction histidine kinase